MRHNLSNGHCKMEAGCLILAALLVLMVLPFPIAEAAANEHQIVLTPEEETYLRDHPTVVVAADTSWRPIEYLDEKSGTYCGIISQILTRLQGYTGLQFEFQLFDNYALALDAVRTGQADMISGLSHSQEAADAYQMSLSIPYLTINSSIVSKTSTDDLYRGKSGTIIAVVDGDSANAEIQSELPTAVLLPLESSEACLQAVKKEEANFAVIAAYCAEYYMSVPKFSNLHFHTISDFSWQQSFGIRGDADPCLLSILDKGIQAMEHLDLNEAVYLGVIGAAYDNDFMILIYRHPLAVLTGVISIIAVISVLLAVIYTNRHKEQMRQLEDGTRLRLALERTHLCIWELDLASHCITKIDNAQEHHGFYDLRENIPESTIEAGYIHPDDIALVRSAMGNVTPGSQDTEHRWRIKELSAEDGKTVYWWEQVLFHIVFDEHNRPVKAIGVSEDVTNEMDSRRDSLTSVYNRKSFEQLAESVLFERRNAYLQCAFLILDLDGFKQINDTYGHSMGDRVLVSVGATLSKTFRSTDIVGRLGGDEFTVFMTSISKEQDATRKAGELVENICALQEKDGFPFPISCSVGVVVSDRGTRELPVLYKQADSALYEAKKAGKNQYRLYLTEGKPDV